LIKTIGVLGHNDKRFILQRFRLTHAQLEVNILKFNETVRAAEVNVIGPPLKRAWFVALHGIDYLSTAILYRHIFCLRIEVKGILLYIYFCPGWFTVAAA
jgi:hypothetical protein